MIRGNRARVVLDLSQNLKFVRSSGYFWWTSGARDNPMWANFGKQNWRWPSSSPPCPFKTCPCVRSKRLRVYRHHAYMFQHVRVVPVYTWTFWTYTRARFEWTHGVFTVPQHTPHRTHTTTQDTTQHNNTTTTQHRDRQRQTETDRDRDRERRQGQREKRKTAEERQEKRRQNKQYKTRQECKEKMKHKTREERREKMKHKTKEERREKMNDKTREERRDKKREEERRREKKKEKRRDTMKKKREDEREKKRHDEKEERRWKEKMKREMKRGEQNFFFFEKMFETPKPARWIIPKCFQKKIPFGRIIPPFFLRMFRIWPCFQFTWFEFDFSGLGN